MESSEKADQEPPAETPTIIAFRRVWTRTRLTAVLLVVSVLGVVAGAVGVVWLNGAVALGVIGGSIAVLIVGMRLGIHTNTRHLALLQESPRPEDLEWLRAWVDLSPNVASLVAVRLENASLDMDILYSAWRLARAEGVVDPTTLVGIRPETVEQVRQAAQRNLRSEL